MHMRTIQRFCISCIFHHMTQKAQKEKLFPETIHSRSCYVYCYIKSEEQLLLCQFYHTFVLFSLFIIVNSN